MKDNKALNKKIMAILIAVYFVILIWIIVLKLGQYELLHIEDNLAKSLEERLFRYTYPFESLITVAEFDFSIEYYCYPLNIILLIPFGILFRFFFNNKATFLILFSFILGVEIFQLFTGMGGIDITDILFNVLGGVIGMLLYNKFRHKMSDSTINKITKIHLWIFAPVALFVIGYTIYTFPDLIKYF
jgi:glycopeptide antibiotics resistance protein